MAEASGIAGVYNFGGGGQQQDNTVQQFAELMFRQKESQMRSDQAILQTVTDMASKGITLTPEMSKAVQGATKRLGLADHIEHFGNARAAGADPQQAAASAAVAAPLPPGAPPLGVGPGAMSPMGPPQGAPPQQTDPFSALAQIVLQGQQAQIEQTRAQTGYYNAGAAAQTATTATEKEKLTQLQEERALQQQATGGGPGATDAAMRLMVRHNPTVENIAAFSLPADQKEAFFEAKRRQMVDELSDQKLRVLSLGFAKDNADMFGGDGDKARQYFSDVVAGKAPTVTPQPTPKYLSENMDVAMKAAVLQARGVPSGWLTQFIAAKGDLSKVPGLKGIIDPETLTAQAAAVRANAEMIASQTGAKLADSEIALRVSGALHNMAEINALAATGNSKALDTQLKITEGIRNLDAASKNGIVDPSIAIGFAKNTAPYLNLAPQDVPNWLFWSKTIFNPMGGLPDHNDPKVQQQYQNFLANPGLSQSFRDMQPLQSGAKVQLGPPQSMNMEDMFNQLLQRSMQNIRTNAR